MLPDLSWLMWLAWGVGGALIALIVIIVRLAYKGKFTSGNKTHDRLEKSTPYLVNVFKVVALLRIPLGLAFRGLKAVFGFFWSSKPSRGSARG